MRLLLLLLLTPFLALAQDEPAPAEDTGEMITRLLAEMTIEEKVGQMTQLALGAVSSKASTPESPGAHTIDPTLRVSEFDTLLISVDLTNTGKREGTEIIQLYIRDPYASITPPVKLLRGFERLTFEIPVTNLAFIGTQNTWQFEAGDFEVYLGDQIGKFTAQ